MPELGCMTSDHHDPVHADVRAVCLLVPPLWELDRFVAVNPFLGFTTMPLEQAACAVHDGLGGHVLPSTAHFRRLRAQGRFGSAETQRAAAALGIDARHLEAILDGNASVPMRNSERVVTRAESIDRVQGTRWEHLARESAATWCAEHVCRGDGTRGLFEAWLDDACLDGALEVEGLSGFRNWVQRLPRSAEQATARMLDRLEIAAWDRQAYLYRLLGGVQGWAALLRGRSWVVDRDDPGMVRELLAIRVCLDAAVASLAPAGVRTSAPRCAPEPVEDERFRLALQDALEDRQARSIADHLMPPVERRDSRPIMQAAFCIDVRSERVRRHLEALDPGIETLGFAGFFGVAMRWSAGDAAEDRCPVLVRPALDLLGGRAQRRSDHAPIAAMLRAPAAAFPAVETLGLSALAGLLRRAVGRMPHRPRFEETRPFQAQLQAATDVATRVEIAAGLLKGMSLRDRFARLVMLCGHQGHCENNAHAAGLDCGACGGHGGAPNARVAAWLLNEPAVRSALSRRGFVIPADTLFVAAVHDTTIDEVRLLDIKELPASHARDVSGLRAWLDRATQSTRRERAAEMGSDHIDDSRVRLEMLRRATDWSQTRPEWALARNMAFIAARRSRTAGRDLGGRAFLHEYDASIDPHDAVLTQVMCAPMVVASWINLQYFASTVDNRTFGSGDKMLHNRVGSIGVVSGNGADLRVGLPLQSVQGPDGRAFHEPLRLQVFVEASTERIDRVLRANPAVRDLVENGWVRLFALSPNGAAVARRVPGLGWEPFHGETIPQAVHEGHLAKGSEAHVDVPEQPRARAAAPRQGS